MQIEGQRFLVVGLARSGLAAARFLHRRKGRVTVNDQASEERLQPWIKELPSGVRLVLGGHPQEEFLAADCIILSPGVPASIPPLGAAREREVPILAEVELAYRFLKGKLVGITGSNGKTTTTTLLGHLLSMAGRDVRVAGNVGNALIAAVDADEMENPGKDDHASNRSERCYVTELSSFQLETIDTLHPHIALLLNITPDHLDRYSCFDDYRHAKERIFLNQGRDDWAVLNWDDPHCRRAAEPIAAKVFPFSRKQPLPEGACLGQDGKLIVCRHQDKEIPILAADRFPLPGKHNLENALAACAAGFLLGLSGPEMADGLLTFKGVEHRLEWCGSSGGIDFYNDSKATNVDSALKAIEAFPARKLLLIMGGLDKGGDFTSLREVVAENVNQLFLIGAASSKIAAQLKGSAPLVEAGEIERAVDEALKSAREGDVVLLAPGCASFDQFDNFAHRGEVFKRVVQERLKSHSPEEAPQGRSRESQQKNSQDGSQETLSKGNQSA
ncbi:MAG TPA: UDP-N-acetylmuramoyl-L-alanine--D-glutamate ligase [Acidobacteriota bacterium]|nr:UDP-N-acetylmuramoyl-L-alanine--D-glutamate ligase [Acidobacteriota bacterium]